MALNPSCFFKLLVIYFLEHLVVISAAQINSTEDISWLGYPSCSYSKLSEAHYPKKNSSHELGLVGNWVFGDWYSSFWCLTAASHMQLTASHLYLSELSLSLFFFSLRYSTGTTDHCSEWGLRKCYLPAKNWGWKRSIL